MFIRIGIIIFLCACIIPGLNAAQTRDEQDILQLRQAIEQLRSEYEARIQELEQRVSAAEQRAAQAETAVQSAPQANPPLASPGTGSSMFSRAFNPAIGVIFQGQAWDYDRHPKDYHIPGFPLGGEAGPVTEGLSLGETEVDFSANVDNKFTAWLTMPIVVEDGEVNVELEEAWIETLGLPGGFAARFGRFFSGIGYLNGKHSHTWDFIDQPLPYQVFLGGQYLDDGVQLRWLAPTDLYLELGAEALRGDRYPAVGAANAGVGSYSAFAHLGGDVGFSHSWLAGLSYLHADSRERQSGSADDPLLFNGGSDVVIADLVWKWAPQGNWKQKNFILQGEYLWREEDGDYSLTDGRTVPYDKGQDGWYVQAVYQPFPHWRFGARFDTVSSGNPGVAFAGTDLIPAGNDPKRFSVMADWSNSEFSRLRLQYTRDESGAIDDNQWGLQYIFSIGAHGAHTF